jgi:asparagine synthetase B (glutamine-hydrolysing)
MDELRGMGGGEVSEFRCLLRQAVQKLLHTGTPALLLSGGTDSSTVLWTLIDCGLSPHCYTFTLQGTPSPDLPAARKIAKHHGLKLTEVVIPRRLDVLKADVERAVDVGARKKTHVQCLQPLLHLLPAIDEQQASDAIRHGKDRRLFRQVREQRFADETTSGFSFWRSVAQQHGKELCVPYRDRDLVGWLLSQSWEQLNKPRQKMPALAGFMPEFKSCGVWRRNVNLQCASGIREWHEELLADKSYNVHGRRSVAALYRDVASR